MPPSHGGGTGSNPVWASPRNLAHAVSFLSLALPDLLVAPIIAANSTAAHVANTTIGRSCWKSRKYAAFRSAVTVAAEGSHCETKANGRGRSGGATAPPLELLPRTTKNNQVGTIAHRPTSTDISLVNEATAT